MLIILRILVEGDIYGFNRRFGAPEKRFNIKFSKANTKGCLTLHYSACNSCFLLMENKYFNLKPTINMLTFQQNFFWEVFLMDLVLVSLEKYGNGSVYDFSVNYNSYDKSDMLNIYKYLMNKNNMK